MIGATPEKQTEQSARSSPVLGDRFVLEARLAQGRLGTMYRALDRMGGRDGRPYVSVLILPGEISRNRDQLAGFEEQLEIVRALSHPNIVRIFGLERDGDTTFLVLEWIDAESLRSVVDSLAPETVCEADALGVIRAVGNALVHAHSRGVVHGDIRPENVLVTERGEVRLLFTSACLVRSAPFPITPRDDVRGLAALAYELMAGAPPPIASLSARDKLPAPQPIAGLSKTRWKALKSALAQRDGKFSSVRGFLAALELTDTSAPSRAARPERASDRKQGSLLRVVLGGVIGAVLAAAAVVSFMIWSDAADRSPGLSMSPSTFGASAERAAEAAREGLADARARLARASGALSARLNDRRGTASPSVESATAVPPAIAPASGAADGSGRSAARDPGGSLTTGDDAGAAVLETFPFATGESSAAAPLEAPAETPAAAESAAVEPPEPAPAAESAAPGGESGTVLAAAGAPTAGAAAPGMQVAFSQREYVVSESAGVAAIEVRRNDSVGDTSFVWWTRDGTARSGEDYADLGRSVERFRDGEAAVMLYVPIISDSIVEAPREHFEVHLGVLSPEGNQVGALLTARVTILDDDG